MEAPVRRYGPGAAAGPVPGKPATVAPARPVRMLRMSNRILFHVIKNR